MKALRRAHQQGEIIPLSVWSLGNLITLALQMLQTDSEESQKEQRMAMTDIEGRKTPTRNLRGSESLKIF